MSVHGGLRWKVDGGAPAEDVFWRVVNRVTRRYSDSKLKVGPKGLDMFTRGKVLEAILRLDWQSSPGYPYCLNYTSNSQMFKVTDGKPDPLVVESIIDLVLDHIEKRTVDPIRVFVKPEPHKNEKILNGRFRLISSVSVVDQIIDHMLYGELNDKFIREFPHIPSRAGWTPYGGGWKWVPQNKVVAIDKSSWDWTVPGWLLEAVEEVRANLTGGDDLWQDLSGWRYRSLFGHPVFVTSGGVFLRQNDPGVMKSGCVNTISDNSIMQVILHELVCLTLNIDPGEIWAMGDDTLQARPADLSSYMRELSKYCIVKQAVEEAEFCGHVFQGDLVEPAYFGKHCFTLLHASPLVQADLCRSYSLLYHRSSRRDFIKRVLESFDCEIPNSRLVKAIFDGE